MVPELLENKGVGNWYGGASSCQCLEALWRLSLSSSNTQVLPTKKSFQEQNMPYLNFASLGLLKKSIPRAKEVA